MRKMQLLALGIVGAVFVGLVTCQRLASGATVTTGVAAADFANGSLTIECNICINDDFQPNQPIRLAALFYRPSGSGPFPLVVINHGTPSSAAMFPNVKNPFTRAARWFVSQGYFVVVAFRPGFNTSEGKYSESAMNCSTLNYYETGRTIGQIESAIVRSAAQLPSVDPTRIVVVGLSSGGFGAIALADDPPPGVVGVINFAGGFGGDGKGNLCRGAAPLIANAGTFGKTNRLPQLWLYAANDHWFAPTIAHAMAQEYAAGSRPSLTFVDLPAFGSDGHDTLSDADPSEWAPAVSTFLANILAVSSPPARNPPRKP